MPSNRSTDTILKERIAHAEGRIEFWKLVPEVQSIWKGIKAELEELRRILSG